MTELEMLKLANEGHVRMIADLAAERDRLKINLTKTHSIIFDLDEELNATRVERNRLRDALYIMNLSNVGHVKLIANRAAEFDQIKRELEAARKAMGVTE